MHKGELQVVGKCKYDDSGLSGLSWEGAFTLEQNFRHQKEKSLVYFGYFSFLWSIMMFLRQSAAENFGPLFS